MFHMPIFIFFSGYLSKNDKNPKVFKLIISYFGFQTLYLLFQRYILNDSSIVFQYTTPYWIMWYLLSLFFWRLITPYVQKSYFSLSISILLALLIGFDSSISFYLSLSRTIVFYPFFLAGTIIDGCFFDYLQQNKNRIISLFLLVLCFIILYLISIDLNEAFLYNAYPYSYFQDNNFQWFFYKLFLIFSSFILVFVCISLIPNKKIPLFSAIGNHTMSIYLLHGFILKWLAYLSFFDQFKSTQSTFYILPLAILITIILSFIKIDALIKTFSLNSCKLKTKP